MRVKRLFCSVPLLAGSARGAAAAATGAMTPATAPELLSRSRRDHLPNRPMPCSRSDVSDDVDLDQRIAGNAGGWRPGGTHRRDVTPVEAAIDRVHAVIIFQVIQEDADLQAFLQRGPRFDQILLDLLQHAAGVDLDIAGLMITHARQEQ